MKGVVHLIFGKHDKNDNLAVNLSLVDGVPNWLGGSSIRLVQDDENERVSIESRISKKYPPAYLKYDQITAAEEITEQEVSEKSKSVIGRAAVGGLVLGPLGAVIGGLSGTGNKSKTEYKRYFVLNYLSAENSEPKAISFEIVGATLHLEEFLKSLKGKLPGNASISQYL